MIVGTLHHVVRPVAPTGEKNVKVSKLPWPRGYDAAFTWKAMREVQSRDDLRQKKQHVSEMIHSQTAYTAIGAIDGKRTWRLKTATTKGQNRSIVPARGRRCALLAFSPAGQLGPRSQWRSLLTDVLQRTRCPADTDKCQASASCCASQAPARFLQKLPGACRMSAFRV